MRTGSSVLSPLHPCIRIATNQPVAGAKRLKAGVKISCLAASIVLSTVRVLSVPVLLTLPPLFPAMAMTAVPPVGTNVPGWRHMNRRWPNVVDRLRCHVHRTRLRVHRLVAGLQHQHRWRTPHTELDTRRGQADRPVNRLRLCRPAQTESKQGCHACESSQRSSLHTSSPWKIHGAAICPCISNARGRLRMSALV